MNVRRAIVCATLLGLFACGKKDDGDDKQTSSPSAAASASGAPSAEPKAEAKPTIEPRVRTEVDNRPDGIVGNQAAAVGATAILQTPKEWATTKGDPTLYASPDKKAQLAVTAYNPVESAAPKLPQVASAFGLAACEWGPPEPLVVGKTKVAATGADGVCKRGAAVVRAAYVATTVEKLLVVGAWDQDGDASGVFGAMRSITKVQAIDPLAPCCAALRQNARSAPPDQANYLIMAANVCDGLRKSPQGRAQLAQIRAGLRGARLPSQCR